MDFENLPWENTSLIFFFLSQIKTASKELFLGSCNVCTLQIQDKVNSIEHNTMHLILKWV